MRLSSFILANMEAILQEWEDFARELGAVTESMDAEALRDHAKKILQELAADLETRQSEAQQEAKSKGKAPSRSSEAPDTAAEQHGGVRADEGFSLKQMVSEYRALRASVLRLWGKQAESHEPAAVDQVTRFNEAIDEALAESVKKYTHDLERAMATARATERMAALGTLSAGLGHDMSNVLLPMRASLDALGQTDQPPDALPMLESLRRSVDHLRGLTQGLRSLSVDPDDPGASTETTDLHMWWAEATSPYKWSLPREIQLHSDGLTPSELPPVRVPKHVLMQAVFNLLQNAADALAANERGGGNIWLSAMAADDGSTVSLSVRDDGPGMSPETLARCTEPFFTTKPRARGTGLGLALVRSIIERHGGRLLIESQPNQGSTFTLVMPAAESGARPEKLKQRAIITVREPRQLGVIRALLSTMGVEVSDGGAGTAEGATLWVADESADPHAVKRFLNAGGPNTRVVALGEWASTERAGQDGRMFQIDATPSYDTLQETLRDALNGSTP